MADAFLQHFRTLALYNRWANARLYKAVAAHVPQAELAADRGAFFTSLLGVLNHLVVADRIWLARLHGQSPRSYVLDEILHPGLPALLEARQVEDKNLIEAVFALDGATLLTALDYVTGTGAPQRQAVHHMLAHVFNHQTHHRGQAHDLLCQIAGRDGVPVLDMLGYQRFFMAGDAP